MDDSRNGHAVIFDLDGTLADTLDDIVASVNVALSRVGAPLRSREEVIGMIGEGAIKLTQRALGADHEHELHDALSHFAEHYRQHALDQTRLFDQIPEQLTRLHANGWRFAILSNKPHEFTAQCANALLTSWPFEAVCGANSDTPKKPDPAVALSIVRQWNLPATEVYFVGDSTVDMQTARNAGMVPVACLWGYGDRRELLNEKPDLIADTASVLAELLINHAASRKNTTHLS